MLGGDDDLGVVGVGDEIHCAAHPFEDFAGDHVVGQIADCTDLEGLGLLESEMRGVWRTYAED